MQQVLLLQSERQEHVRRTRQVADGCAGDAIAARQAELLQLPQAGVGPADLRKAAPGVQVACDAHYHVQSLVHS